MKKDLCAIAGVVNTNEHLYASAIECHAASHTVIDEGGYHRPMTYFEACMDIFCRAKKIVEAAGEDNTAFHGYATLFNTANFHLGFELIFCSNTHLRTLANNYAHALPPLPLNLEDLLAASCPKGDRKIAKICFDAFQTYRPLEDRLELQTIEENEKWKARRAENWKSGSSMWRLTEWLNEVPEVGDVALASVPATTAVPSPVTANAIVA